MINDLMIFLYIFEYSPGSFDATDCGFVGLVDGSSKNKINKSNTNYKLHNQLKGNLWCLKTCKSNQF